MLFVSITLSCEISQIGKNQFQSQAHFTASSRSYGEEVAKHRTMRNPYSILSEVNDVCDTCSRFCQFAPQVYLVKVGIPPRLLNDLLKSFG